MADSMIEIVTFVEGNNYDDIKALTFEEFKSDETFDEWVWHLAPSKKAAIERHHDAFDAFVDTGQSFFDHSKEA